MSYDKTLWKCEADQKEFENAIAALSEPDDVLNELKNELLDQLDCENISSSNIWDLVQEIEAAGGYIELMF